MMGWGSVARHILETKHHLSAFRVYMLINERLAWFLYLAASVYGSLMLSNRPVVAEDAELDIGRKWNKCNPML